MFCRDCRYPLSHITSHQCPECGRRFNPASPRTYLETLHSGTMARLARVYGEWIAWIVIAVGLACASWVVLVDGMFGISSLRFFVPLVLVFAVIGAVTAMHAGRSRGYAIPFVLLAVLLIVLRFVQFSPVKPFVRAQQSISAGMTQAQVRTIISQNFPANGRHVRPVESFADKGRLCFILDPTDGRYNAATLDVRFVNGKCVDARFSPD